ncbi:MAG: hypothetical protein HYU69_05100 [Bacteroidetes bacterium]|nr:hypothetical protein [Bacteroidota bacterium]
MKRTLKILIILLFACSGVWAQHADTVVDPTSFPLSDPRNPNCPCHKLQQLADEEYRKSQKKDPDSILQQKVKQKDEVDRTKNINSNDKKIIQRDELSNPVISLNNIQIQQPLVQDGNYDLGSLESGAQNDNALHRGTFSKEASSKKSIAFFYKRSALKKFFCKVGRKWQRIFRKKKSKAHHVDNCFSWNV